MPAGELARPRQFEKHEERAIADVVTEAPQAGSCGLASVRVAGGHVQRAAARVTPTRVAVAVRPTRLCRLAHRSPLPCASARRVATVTESRNSHYRWLPLVDRLTRTRRTRRRGGFRRGTGHGQRASLATVAPSTANEEATYLLFVRHGTTPTTGKVLPGRAPGLHLSDAGRAEAGAVGTRLGELGSVRALYSSPMERAVETAEQIAALYQPSRRNRARAYRVRLRGVDRGGAALRAQQAGMAGRPASSVRLPVPRG